MVLSFVPQTPCRTSETNMCSVKKQNKNKNKKTHTQNAHWAQKGVPKWTDHCVKLLHSQFVCWSNCTILGHLLHWSFDPLNPTTRWGISLSYSAWLSVSYFPCLQVRSVKAAFGFCELIRQLHLRLCLLQFSWSEFWLNRLYCNPATMGGTIQCTPIIASSSYWCVSISIKCLATAASS